ncbi:disease resistance protein RGA2-like [Vitis riparia]|uniref:disease resistance protein RGA2-like n=1 Tax=Vitis riparia TaxID=96939 RepID=UPI00155A8405|nr:disease resistance protein RGA2-like [Vitis riparia]
MAESFAFNIADKLLGKATSLVVEQVCLAGGVYSELENIKATLSTVRAVLLDAEEQQVNNHQLTDWLGKLKDCFYDAEDVLDEFEYDSLQRVVVSEGGIKRKVRHFFSSSNPLAFRFKMGNKMKEIRERLDKVAADADKFNLKKMGVNVPVPVLNRKRENYSFVRASDVIGRDDDKENIIQLLMQSSDEENVSVLPLVGIGGLGKTTLAKLVYNDGRVVADFEKRMWVCVSDEFDVKRLIKEIITSATHGKCDDLPMDELARLLINVLDDNKFLLILDDVWSKNRDKWLELKALLDGSAKGSKIIVTTRDKLVASVMGTCPMYELKGLSDEECLSLFITCAFKDDRDKQYPRLVGIGKDIVKKRKGLPLAVKTLGGLLYLKAEEKDWLRVRDSEIWKLEQKKDDVLPALKLSYDELPFYLKQCFASCSLYPKDIQFNNIQLIEMWMGQGLIQPSEQNEEMKDIGNRYIDELLQKSFFQDVEEDVPGFFYCFKMHDLVHDLALLVAQPECSMLNFDSENISTKVRHVSILKIDETKEEETISRFFGKLNNVRTILFRDHDVGPKCESFVITCLLRFKYMRVLNVADLSFEELPNSICNLKHLRYLNLIDNNSIKKLPNSICKLHHLQTLHLFGCDSFEELPRDVGKMMSLRHLSVTTQQMAFPHKEREVGRRCFNSLRILIIGGCPNLESLMEGMRNFTALRTLIIAECPRLSSLPKHLPALENLIIGDCESLDLGNRNGEKEGNIQGFGSLRNLLISRLPMLEILPRWLFQVPTSNTLLYLAIGYCENFRALSEEEESLSLTSLDTLVIKGCSELLALPEGMGHLTALRQLQIERCRNLAALPEKMRRLTALTQLKIEDCPELAERCKPRRGEDWNKIAHVQDIYLDGQKIQVRKSGLDEAAAGTSGEVED